MSGISETEGDGEIGIWSRDIDIGSQRASIKNSYGHTSNGHTTLQRCVLVLSECDLRGGQDTGTTLLGQREAAVDLKLQYVMSKM